MSRRPIIDAGPALNFLAINRERLLFGVLGRIATPETVAAEVMRKSRTDRRFSAVQRTWPKLTPNWIEVLSDDITVELDRAVTRISALPTAERKAQAKDLGEVMVVAHAAIAAEAGHRVIAIVDDQGGARLATAEQRRLVRLRAQGHPVGDIVLVNTVTILARAAGTPLLPDRAAMRAVYARLRECDDGLLPIEQTPLISTELWAARHSLVIGGSRAGAVTVIGG